MKNLWRPKAYDGTSDVLRRKFWLVDRHFCKFLVCCGLGNHADMHLGKMSMNLDGPKEVFPIIVGFNPLLQFLMGHLKALLKDDFGLVKNHCRIGHLDFWVHFDNLWLLTRSLGLIGLAIQHNQLPIDGIQGPYPQITMLQEFTDCQGTSIQPSHQGS